MTLPGSIKGHETALSVSSSLILAAEQTNFNMRRAHPIFGPLFSQEDHSFIIYSFLLDQLVLKLQVGCLIPALTSATIFFPLYDSQYRVFSQADIKVLELINTLVHIFVLHICLVTKMVTRRREMNMQIFLITQNNYEWIFTHFKGNIEVLLRRVDLRKENNKHLQILRLTKQPVRT